jgi:hypothetical protein
MSKEIAGSRNLIAVASQGRDSGISRGQLAVLPVLTRREPGLLPRENRVAVPIWMRRIRQIWEVRVGEPGCRFIA